MNILPDRIETLLEELRVIEARRREIHADVAEWYSSVSATMCELGLPHDGDVLPASRQSCTQHAGPSGVGLMQPTTQRDMVVNVVQSAGKPVRTREIQGMLRTAGADMSSSNIRAHLAHAVEEGELRRVDRGLYAGKDTPVDPGLPMDEDAVADDDGDLGAHEANEHGTEHH